MTALTFQDFNTARDFAAALARAGVPSARVKAKTDQTYVIELPSVGICHIGFFPERAP